MAEPSLAPPRLFEINRRRVSPLVLGVLVILVVAGFSAYVSTRIPVEHTMSANFVVPGTALLGCGRSANFTSSNGGTYKFSWHASSNQAAELYLEGEAINRSSTYQPYDSGGNGSVAGSGSVPLFSSFRYYFEFCGSFNQTASIVGVISYYSPLL